MVQLTTACPAWHRSVYGDKHEWTRTYIAETIESLARHGVTKRSQVSEGIRALKKAGARWLPAPDEFAALCASQEVTALPSVEFAYKMAVEWQQTPTERRHPAVMAAVRLLDWHAFVTSTRDRSRLMFQQAWAQIKERAAAEGSDWMPDPCAAQAALPAPKVDMQLNRSKIAELRSVIKGGLR